MVFSVGNCSLGINWNFYLRAWTTKITNSLVIDLLYRSTFSVVARDVGDRDTLSEKSQNPLFNKVQDFVKWRSKTIIHYCNGVRLTLAWCTLFEDLYGILNHCHGMPLISMLTARKMFLSLIMLINSRFDNVHLAISIRASYRGQGSLILDLLRLNFHVKLPRGN